MTLHFYIIFLLTCVTRKKSRSPKQMVYLLLTVKRVMRFAPVCYASQSIPYSVNAEHSRSRHSLVLYYSENTRSIHYYTGRACLVTDQLRRKDFSQLNKGEKETSIDGFVKQGRLFFLLFSLLVSFVCASCPPGQPAEQFGVSNTFYLHGQIPLRQEQDVQNAVVVVLSHFYSPAQLLLLIMPVQASEYQSSLQRLFGEQTQIKQRKREAKEEGKDDSTSYSQGVTNTSNLPTHQNFTSVVGREPLFSSEHGRGHFPLANGPTL